MTELFALAAADMRPLAEGRGSCLASDRITVAGQPVGFMYREPPDHSIDSSSAGTFKLLPAMETFARTCCPDLREALATRLMIDK